MPFQLPMIDTSSKWTGQLACLDDEAAERAGDDFGEVVRQYVATGQSDALSAAGCWVTLRPLSAAEEDASEAEAGMPVALAGFLYREMQAAGVDLSDERAVAASVAAMDECDRAALHQHELRMDRLRWARVCRALVAADFAEDGKPPALMLERVARDIQRHIIIELAAHLDRLCSLSAEGKAHAGPA